MADVRAQLSRLRILIEINNADIVSIMQQQDLIQSFRDEQLKTMSEVLQGEINYRKGEENELNIAKTK